MPQLASSPTANCPEFFCIFTQEQHAVRRKHHGFVIFGTNLKDLAFDVF